MAIGEYYHVFNRGVEKRDIFLDTEDLERFLESVQAFNSVETVGSLFEHRFNKMRAPNGEAMQERLVELISYCLNPNHFHLLLRQVAERGIQKFMQKLGTGYTNYFNERYKRTGALFQGRYKAVHVGSNEQLLHTSVYVNLNNQLGSSTPKLSRSSWPEYAGGLAGPAATAFRGVCAKEIILGQFSTPDKYKEFAKSSLEAIVEQKRKEKELQLLGS